MQVRAVRAAHSARRGPLRRRLAERGGEVVGGTLLDLGTSEALHVVELAVLPQARRRGVATMLLHDAIAIAGSRDVTLQADRDNDAALALYGREGFAVEEETATRVSLRRPAGPPATG